MQKVRKHASLYVLKTLLVNQIFFLWVLLSFYIVSKSESLLPNLFFLACHPDYTYIIYDHFTG